MHDQTHVISPVDERYVRGAAELETTDRGVQPHRLPAWVRRQIPDGQLLMAQSQPSGVRLVLRTSATWLELDTIPTKRVYPGVPPRPDGIYDLIVDGQLVGCGTVTEGDTMLIDLTTGGFEMHPGSPGTVRFDDLTPGPKCVEIWLPHDEATLLVALRGDAPIEPAPASGRPTWLHHGSSISHGSNAASPTSTWPAVASARAGVELVNLGLGGSALLDPAVARAIRDTPADLITLKIGINLVNLDLMRRRAFGPAVHGFLDTIREGHPLTPLVVVSPVWCPIHEETPGPCAPDPEAMARGELRFLATGDSAEVAQGKLTLGVIREELSRLVDLRSGADPYLSYLDGRDLYGEADYAEQPLPDELHPDTATHRLIGERFADRMAGWV